MYPWHGREAEPVGELGDERCERNGAPQSIGGG